MKKLILIIIVTFISFSVYAKSVEYEIAAKVAKAQYYSSMKSVKQVEISNIEIKCSSNPSLRNSENKFYVFDFICEENHGYVMVASDDKIKPILSFSLKEKFDDKNIAPGLKMLFDYYNKCLEAVSTRSDLTIDESVTLEWDYLSNYDYADTRSQAYTSSTLLEGINWNQGWPYNTMCPTEEKSNKNGLKGHSPVGCVAVATCQVMKYYNWPPSGTKSYTHVHTSGHNMDNIDNPNPVPGYGSFTVNFAEQDYLWSKVPGSASGKENDELAKICYQVGVAIKMGWGITVSGAWPKDVAAGLPEYFNYSSGIRLLKKDNFSDIEWQDLLKEEIDANRPMIYSGYSSTIGHAWNCDGYNVSESGSTTFHMNWGWGGYGNNYCTLDNLIAAGAAGGDEYNFSISQDAICNIIPKLLPNEEYPKFCQDVTLITGQEGSFDDGSSYQNYKPNGNCEYVIKPEKCGTQIKLSFSKFEIQDGDYLHVYEGEGNQKKLINSFSSSNLPPSGTSKSDRIKGLNAITMFFETKDEVGENAKGWTADYVVSNCSLDDPLVFTDNSRSFTDGSGEECNYIKGTRCKWLIKPDGAKSIRINIDKFDIDKGDVFQMFKGNTTSSTARIVRIENGATPEDYYIVGSEQEPIGEVTVHFIAKQTSVGAAGWQVSYLASNTSIDEISSQRDFTIMPNPGDNQSKLRIRQDKPEELKVVVVDVMGRLLGDKIISVVDGENTILIDEIVNKNLDAGVYFISLLSENSLINTAKFIVVGK